MKLLSRVLKLHKDYEHVPERTSKTQTIIVVGHKHFYSLLPVSLFGRPPTKIL